MTNTITPDEQRHVDARLLAGATWAAIRLTRIGVAYLAGWGIGTLLAYSNNAAHQIGARLR